MCVITAALKVCPWNSHACAFKFLSEIRLQSQNWTQPLKMTSWGALPATGDVKTKCQQSFQAFLGNEMTFKGARLGLPFGWQTCLIIMFPCGRLLCNSLDTHSGQLRAVWGQQESITINRPFGVKRRWSDDLTDDSCWLCLPEGPLIKNSAEDLHNTVTVPLQSERGCAVLPSICFFPPGSSGPFLWICSSVFTRLSRLFLSPCRSVRAPSWGVILPGKETWSSWEEANYEPPTPPFETVLQSNKTFPWSSHGTVLLSDVLLGN